MNAQRLKDMMRGVITQRASDNQWGRGQIGLAIDYADALIDKKTSATPSPDLTNSHAKFVRKRVKALREDAPD